MRGPGIEPGSTAWKATMLTITPATLPRLTHEKSKQKDCILRGSNSRGLCPLGLKSSALTTRPRMQQLSKKMQKIAPGVRLELTTYRLTAGRAADCAIQELMMPQGKT